MLSIIEYDSKHNLRFAEFHCAKPDKRGNKWIYPITAVADGKAKHATKAEQKIAMEWVENRLGKPNNIFQDWCQRVAQMAVGNKTE